MDYVFLVLKQFDSWSKKCPFRSIFGSVPVEISAERNNYSIKRFVFEFQEESLEQFLSYRAHFRRYEHFKEFWQSTASSYRDCWPFDPLEAGMKYNCLNLGPISG